MLSEITQLLRELWATTGYANMTLGNLIMLLTASFFLYLAIARGYEPLLLLPISFGMFLVNLPLSGLMAGPTHLAPGGLFFYLHQGVKLGVYPPLIFLGVGAMTDFGPLIANPKTFMLGAAAQFGIFTTLIGAVALGFTPQEAAAI